MYSTDELLMGCRHSFEQSAFLCKKLAYHWLLVIGKLVQMRTFSSNSDGWRLAMQTYFSLKIQHIPVWFSGDVDFMGCRKLEESIKISKSTYFDSIVYPFIAFL